MDPRRYLLDANVFIAAAKQYYAFDLAPKFWACLLEHAQHGRVLSIDRVKAELLRGNDDLAEWAGSAFAEAFAKTDDDAVLKAFADVMAWSQKQSFTDPAKAAFAKCADGWLVAYAKAHDCVVVTHETFDPNSRKRVKIPNACEAFGVEYVDTWTMLRELRARLG